MKKFILSSIFILITAFSFGQSVTIVPNQTTNSSSQNQNIIVRSNTTGLGIYGYRHNGTLVVPTAVTSGQDLFRYSGGGHYGSGFDNGGSLRFHATENWASSVSGTKASIWTIPNGTITQFEKINRKP